MTEPRRNSREKPRLRRAMRKLVERNRHHRNPLRVSLAIRPTQPRLRNYNSVLSPALKHSCGGAVFTKVPATGSSARIWNFPSAHFSRAWELCPTAGSTWRRWLRSVCCPAKTAVPPWKSRAVVLCPPRSRRYGANGFTNRCRNESTATPR